MKKFIYGLIALVIIFLLWFAYNFPDWIVAGPPKEQHNSATCPQFVRGYDDNGNPICGYVTGCPYGDSIPLGPECDKHAPENVNQTPEKLYMSELDVNEMEGK